MIQSITVKNFQSHKNTTLDFPTGVSVITGQSDSGKSSIVRALLWVLNNRPSGDAIRNWKAQERDITKVGIVFSDGLIVVKERAKGKSSYIVNVSDSIDRFEAIKQDVPDEVSKIAKLTDCNVQTQHEPYFLLNESPGEVARRLNEIVGLDIIDVIFKNLDRRIRTVSGAIKVHNDTATRLTDEIKEIEFADEFHDRVVALKKKQEDVDKLERSINALKELHQQIGDIHDELAEAPLFGNMEKRAFDILLKIADFKKVKKDIESLELIVQNVNRVEKEISLEKDWLECEEPCLSLVEKTTEFASINMHLKNLKSVSKDLYMYAAEEASEANQINCKTTRYGTLLKKTKICPICTSPITSKMVNEIVRGL